MPGQCGRRDAAWRGVAVNAGGVAYGIIRVRHFGAVNAGAAGLAGAARCGRGVGAKGWCEGGCSLTVDGLLESWRAEVAHVKHIGEGDGAEDLGALVGVLAPGEADELDGQVGRQAREERLLLVLRHMGSHGM
eukprot:5503832-Prymnesium_polylepis.1